MDKQLRGASVRILFQVTHKSVTVCVLLHHEEDRDAFSIGLFPREDEDWTVSKASTKVFVTLRRYNSRNVVFVFEIFQPDFFDFLRCFFLKKFDFDNGVEGWRQRG